MEKNESKAFQAGVKKLYIHYNPENYEGPVFNQSSVFLQSLVGRMKDAKARMVSNLYEISSQHLSPEQKKLLDAYANRNGGKEAVVKAIAEQVKANFGRGLAGWHSGAQGLYSKKRAERSAGLQQMMDAVSEYAGIATKRGSSFYNLKDIKRLRDIVAKGGNAQTIANALGSASEIAALIESFDDAKDAFAKRTIKDILGTQRIGENGRWVFGDVKRKSNTIEVFSKAADFTNKVTLKPEIVGNELASLLGTISFYGSAKQSINSKATRVVQMGNERFLTRFVEEFFGATEGVRYAYYNAMVLGSEASEKSNMNYRVIRAALMADLVDYYLSGANSEHTQLVLVKNGMAYSMVGILESIISKFAANPANFLVEGDTHKIGFYSNGFTVKISGKAANAWEPPEEKNRRAAYARTSKSREVIDKITTRGEINLKVLLDNAAGEGIKI